MNNLPLDFCCGCSACEQKCPTGSIRMKRDNEGFLRPVINEITCSRCNVCEKVCPELTEKKGYAYLEAYGCTLNDKRPLSQSTSGGFFYAIADHVIKKSGVVYGALYKDAVHVAHERITDSSQLCRLQKSKYSQSNLMDSFRCVQRDVLEKKTVLFSGTPCQIAGLQCFLGTEYPNLILVQVFCSEVVSPLAWERYVEYLNDEYSIKAAEVDTRCKLTQTAQKSSAVLNWKMPVVRIMTQSDHTLDIPREKDWFTTAFAEHLISRKSCSECGFKMSGNKIFADISIGDFWGCENNAPECFDRSGVSAVVVHTTKGKQFFLDIQSTMRYYRVDPEVIFKGNPGIMQPHKPNKNRENCLSMLSLGELRFDDIIIKSLELDPRLVKRCDRIGLFGSYNTRAALAMLCGKSNCTLSYQFSNSSLISLFSDPVEIPEDTVLPCNPYRAEMLTADFTKSFLSLGNHTDRVNCLVIDFLEERFDIVKQNKLYLTYSDAMLDSSYCPAMVISRLSEEANNIWYESCLKFVEYLSHSFVGSKIILVEAYLSPYYENEDGSMSEFENDNFHIAQINAVLFDCYKYFKANMPNVVVIDQPHNMRYCEYRHKHGIYPWHSNQVYYEYLYKEISKHLMEE